MTDPSIDLTGSRLGNYRLVRLLGRGRMGVVYLANDEALLRPTAVKVLSWNFVKAHGDHPEAWFLAEARSVARINHPCVVQVYSAAKHGSQYYIAMEYVDGVSGEAMVAAKGALPVVNATKVILQIAGALDQAHLNAIIHRDVKPANLLIRSDWTAKLGDFGMALHAAAVNPGSTAPIGTPYYIAPELWQGSPATPRSDIYALGGTFYCLLTGHPPFGSTDLQTLVNSHLHAPVPDPSVQLPELAGPCLQILQRCLAKSPRDRYQNAQEMAWDLRGLLRETDHPTQNELQAVGNSYVLETSSSAIPRPGLDEPWLSQLGLGERPFGVFSPARCPFQGEPMRGLRGRIRDFLLDRSRQTLVLTGTRGSGISMLLRWSINNLPSDLLIRYSNLKHGDPSAKVAITQWACQAVGALPSTSTGRDVALEGLVEHLSSMPQPVVFAIDGVPADMAVLDPLASLLRAARSTRCMRVLVSGTRDLVDLLRRASVLEAEDANVVEVPTLGIRETGEYIQSWLNTVRRPGSPGLLLSRDAEALIHYRTQGNIAIINALTTNMLRAAAHDKRRVLSSWHAWSLPLHDDPLVVDLIAPAPPDWPTHEVLDILNTGRNQAGIMPRQHPSEMGDQD